MSQIQSVILGAILAVFAGLGLTVAVQHHRLAAVQARYETLSKDADALRAENAQWKLAADNQNRKIAALAAAQKARDAAAASAVVAARKNAARYAERVRAIDALKPTPDDCAGAKAIRDAYMEHSLVK